MPVEARISAGSLLIRLSNSDARKKKYITSYVY
jgi:hypothetical protein